MRAELAARHGAAAAASLGAFNEIVRTIAFAGETPVLASIVPLLREFLGSEQAMAYRLLGGDDGLDVDFAHASGMGPEGRVIEIARGYITRTKGQITAYHVPVPTPAERNAVYRLVTEEDRARHEAIPIVRDLFPLLGLRGQDQIRILVCDGPDLLAWVGGFRLEPFGPEEAERLSLVTDVLAQRLKLEESLKRLSLRGQALDFAMEAIGAPAFILDRRGGVVHANRAGRALGADERADLVERGTRIWAGELPEEEGLSLLRIEGTGLPPHALLVQRSEHSISQRLALFAKRFGLSPRQREVARELLAGKTNKAIGVALGIQEGTVEIHVTNLLRKVGVESRAELAAAFWAEAIR